MDEIKDIQRTDSLSRFLDEHAVRTNPFGDNRAAERAYRRAERISAALHMLTAHIQTNESIRGDIRSCGSSILRAVLDARSDMRAAKSPHVAKLSGEIRYVISLIRCATASGFISLQNATTMIEALDDLGSFVIASQRSVLSEDVSISRGELIDVGMPIARTATRRTTRRVSDTAYAKDNGHSGSGGESSQKNSDSVRDLSVRVQHIIEILKSGNSFGIRDISANLPEYSEKMIQRELLDLVSQGKVKKTGLKRWSKYSLAA